MASPLLRAFTSLVGVKPRGERAFFDDAYYCRSYADVAATGIDPFSHFAGHGWREGRNPSATFNTLFYRDYHLDGAAIDPLAHWVAAGAASSGLPTRPATPQSFLAVQRGVVAEHFDLAFYVLQGGVPSGDPIAHYLAEGWRKGLSPSPHFDPSRYVEENHFVAALGVSPFYHWCSQRRLRTAPFEAASAEPPVPASEIRRVVEPEFDRAYYLARQADVREAGLDPLKHFLEHGWRERRDPHPLFDSRYYLDQNPELAVSKVNPFYHYLTVGRARGLRGNPVGTRPYPAMRAPADWSRARPAADTRGADWIVVIPVYRGYDETLAAVYAVLSARQTTRFALHLVNDRSPDASLVAELERLAGQGLFSYETNPSNLGFVKTCNRALRAFPDKEVVLLNADALVFGDWLDRMAAHARHDPTIATITPSSNNATICSYPLVNLNNIVEPEVDAPTLDRLAAQANGGRVSDVATGVGYCFFMSRTSREAIGLFDEEAFGLGYGEENDFCLRGAKAGFRNVLAEDIFAYHRGEVSFADLTAAEYGPGQKALQAKHPDYTGRVDLHLRADPGRRGRMRLDLKRLARYAGPRVMVFVSHALAGGILTHVRHLEARLREEGVAVIHLRVGVDDRWSVEVTSDASDAPFLPNLLPTSFHQIRDLLNEFLGWLSPMAIHMHSVVGFDWEAATSLFALVRESGLPYFFTLHDYSVVCHRNDLVLTNGLYCGLPDVEACRLCVRDDRSYPEALDPAVRRETYEAFLNGAQAVFAPSRDIADRLARAGATYAITLRPHEEDVTGAPEMVAAAPDPAHVSVVVVGAIGAHKGSRVLLSLARDAQIRGLPIRFHVIGYSDVSAALQAAGVEETGRYRDDAEATRLIVAARPTCILLPSIWPETFCYTLSLAFRLRVPPVVFDIGAQAERVNRAGFGFVLPLTSIDDPAGLNDRILSLPFAEHRTDPPKTAAVYPRIVEDYYGLAVPRRNGTPNREDDASRRPMLDALDRERRSGRPPSPQTPQALP